MGKVFFLYIPLLRSKIGDRLHILLKAGELLRSIEPSERLNNFIFLWVMLENGKKSVG